MLQADDPGGRSDDTGPMPVELECNSISAQAQETAMSAADRARVRIVNEHEMDRLRSVEALLISIWGASQHGAPIPVDLLRSISHAGCNIAAAYDVKGTLCGAAVAIVSPDKLSTYSLIAGVLPSAADSGVGFALKQHQRAWALARGFKTMTWTFDPLVSRNARFNLTKLGAHASEYIEDFYGQMHDGINSNDESDRLLAVWPLESGQTIACSRGETESVELPPFLPEDVLAMGPDGGPLLVRKPEALWCRVPEDIVSLRAQSSPEAAAWRVGARQVFTTAFASGHIATGVTRSGWYRLATGGQG